MKNYLLGVVAGISIAVIVQYRGKAIRDDVERDTALFERYEQGKREGFAAGRQFQKDIWSNLNA
jgi:hypothetical protein